VRIHYFKKRVMSIALVQEKGLLKLYS